MLMLNLISKQRIDHKRPNTKLRLLRSPYSSAWSSLINLILSSSAVLSEPVLTSGFRSEDGAFTTGDAGFSCAFSPHELLLALLIDPDSGVYRCICLG